MSEKEEPFLKVESLCRSFTLNERKIVALDNVNLTMSRGEMLGIVGSSGAGKSTFLYLLGALDKPTFGHVYFDNIDIFSLNDEKLARLRGEKIGFVFQSSQLLPEFSAEENVALALMITGSKRKLALEKSRETLKLVGLGKRLTHRPGKLSGGEQQRVAIARALINEPDLVLADEPTGNLDSKTGAEVFDLILRLNQERDQSFIIVTHNMELASALPKVAAIKDGKFVYTHDDVIE